MKIWTNYDGAILEVTPAAALALNVAARSLAKRPFYLFFTTDRHRALRALDLAIRGHADSFTGQLQPREKKDIRVQVTLEPAPPDAVVWTIAVL